MFKFRPGDQVQDIHRERGRVMRQNNSGTVVVRVWAENVTYSPEELTLINRQEHDDDDLPEQVSDEE